MTEINANPPGALEWRRFLSKSLNMLGAGSVLSAAVCFIAYNWNHMGVSFKFGLAETVMLSLAVLSWKLGLEKYQGQLAIFCAAFMVGPLLAIYGQAYPSGAPLSKLLFLWATITAVVALLARTQGLWLLALALLNAALIYWSALDTVWFLFNRGNTALLLSGLIDLAAFALAMVLPRWLPTSSSRRLLVLSGSIFLNVAFVKEQFIHWDQWQPGPGLLSLLLAIVALMIYSFTWGDLFTLVLAVLGIFSLCNTLIIRGAEHGGAGVFMLLTFLNLIAGAVAVYWLSWLHRQGRGKS